MDKKTAFRGGRKPLAVYIPCVLGAVAAFGISLLGLVVSARLPRETITAWWPYMEALEIGVFLAFMINGVLRAWDAPSFGKFHASPALNGVLRAWDAQRARKRHVTADRLEDEVKAMQARQTGADTTALNAMRARLRRLFVGIRVYAGALCLIACAACFLIGPLYTPSAEGQAAFINSTLYMFLLLFNIFVASCAAGRLWPIYASQNLKVDPNFISESDAPRLYACARRAAEDIGVHGRVHILSASEGTVGIGRYGRDIVIQVNASLLGVLNEDELRAVMLHEFSHLLDDAHLTDELTWLSGDKPALVNIGCTLFFSRPDLRLQRLYDEYRLAFSLFQESEADRAMLEHGDRNAAASLLTKLSYIDLFDWERHNENITGSVSPDRLPEVLFTGRVQAIREAFDRRGEFYASMVMRELPRRVDTHPVISERLKRLGFNGPHLIPDQADTAWRTETERLLRAEEKKLAKFLKESDFEESLRHDEETLSAWKSAGEPIDDSYPDILTSLEHLDRHDEVEALCRRVIAEKGDDDAAAYALFTLGTILVHRWDASGVDLIFEACERNSNALDEGLDTLGEFFFLTGDEAGLERYRAYVHEKTQWSIDIGSEQGRLKKGDALTAERLPAAMAAGLMNKIKSLDAAHEIDKVYVVHKQIDPEHAVTPVVMRFKLETTRDREDELIHQMFLYLDSVDSWHFSLFNADDVLDVPLEKIPGSRFYPAQSD
ncbi:MAG: M48 family metalloprotease [Clostridia bacterium]|nr:M48 family metalloprotease [Clostridia bacterium]